MIAFCHTYKTAGTSFNTILRNHYRWRHFDSPGFQHRALSPENLQQLKWVYPNLQSICGHTIRPYADLQSVQPDIRFYTFIRDPLARSISHFTWFLRWKANDGVFFDDFTSLAKGWANAEVNRNRQCKQLSAEGTFHSVKQVVQENPFLLLRVKHFDKSLLLFRHWANEPDMDLSYALKNTGSDRYERLHSTHPEYLQGVRDYNRFLKSDAAMQEILREANREDQQLLDWVDGEIWPAQIADYPGNLKEDLSRFQTAQQQNATKNREPLSSKLHRNLIFKPLRPLLLPEKDPVSATQSPWL